MYMLIRYMSNIIFCHVYEVYAKFRFVMHIYDNSTICYVVSYCCLGVLSIRILLHFCNIIIAVV